jgi:hypothetical protein
VQPLDVTRHLGMFVIGITIILLIAIAITAVGTVMVFGMLWPLDFEE